VQIYRLAKSSKVLRDWADDSSEEISLESECDESDKDNDADGNSTCIYIGGFYRMDAPQALPEL
jgi:hypothetical protein